MTFKNATAMCDESENKSQTDDIKKIKSCVSTLQLRFYVERKMMLVLRDQREMYPNDSSQRTRVST